MALEKFKLTKVICMVICLLKRMLTLRRFLLDEIMFSYACKLIHKIVCFGHLLIVRGSESFTH